MTSTWHSSMQIIFKGSIEARDEDGRGGYLTSYQKDGYPTLVFSSPAKFKTWLEDKLEALEVEIVV